MSAGGERPPIARAIVELGRALGLQVIAEGIERPDQADWLVSLGCPLGQGYLFSRPLGVDATEAFLAADASRRTMAGDRPVSGFDEPGSATRRSGRGRSASLRLVSGD